MRIRPFLPLLVLLIAVAVTLAALMNTRGPFGGGPTRIAQELGMSWLHPDRGGDGRADARFGGDGAAVGNALTADISTAPWTRWWWFADVIAREDVRAQLAWLKSQGFGGVEIAWVYPLGGDSSTARQEWLSPGWSRIVAETTSLCDSMDMGCDFTFGTLWPFGDSHVPPEDGALTWGDSIAPASMRLTWEHPVRGRVINHLDRSAFLRYAGRMYSALNPALRSGSAAAHGLFCDSWEVETRRIWTHGFDSLFLAAYGYDIRPLMDSLYAPGFAGVHYDYMKLVSRLVLDNFYAPFTASAHAHGAYTRVQSCGSPTDILEAYARADIPETEAILYEPAFARIPASAAALGGKRLVSSETFTCLYGWKGWPGPGPHQGEEQVADLRLLADALFAHGVNHIVWHGTPYNPPGRNAMFYAAVHVAPASALAPHLRAFNGYLARVAEAMRRGRTYSDVAVYLPLEDAWMAGELPDSLQFPWAWGAYEMRYQRMPEFLKGRQPLWVNAAALRRGRVRAGHLHAGDAVFNGLYVDARWLDVETLRALRRVAQQGFPICLVRKPEPPGRARQEGWEAEYRALADLPAVTSDPAVLFSSPPLLRGERIPDFWCRQENGEAWIFFAHPHAEGLSYPLQFGFAAKASAVDVPVLLHWNGIDIPHVLKFGGRESLLVHILQNGHVETIPLEYVPPIPVQN